PSPASKSIKIDDGQDEFSKSYAEDELGVSSRGRGVLIAVAAFLVVAGGAVFAVKRAHRSTLAEEPKEQVAATASGQPTAPVIVPLNDTASTGARPVAAESTGAAGHKSVAPLGAAREELDERAADPRIARERE